MPRAAKVLLGLVAAVAIVVALFDWNWLRGPVESYLAEKSHREVRIGHLGVDNIFTLEPTIRIRDVRIENAPWADKRPFMVAKEAAFTVSIRSLWDEKTVVSKLTLVDADLDMERQEDGLRNWRLRTPDYRGPGKVKVESLEARNTTIRFVRRDVKLDMTATASPAFARGDSPSDTDHPVRVQFKGEFSGAAFEGDVDTATVLTFLDTGRSFPIRGNAKAGKSRIAVDGTIADLFDPSAIDGRIHLSGASLGDLHPLLRAKLPASLPYDFKAHVTQTAENTSFAELVGKIGKSDLTGELALVRGKSKPTLKAALKSKYVDLDDIGPLIGRPQKKAAAPARASAADPGDAPTEAQDGKGAPKRLFSDHAFDGARMKKLDAHVSLEATQFHTAKWPTLQSLRVTADLSDGVLKLDPVDAGVAGGHIAGQLTVDGNAKPLAVHAKLHVKDVRIEQLLAGLSNKAKGSGPLQGELDLKARGNSLAAIAASASGPAEIDLTAGGISNLVDAGIGLNAGKAIRLLITGDQIIAVNNAKVAFDFDKGHGTSKAIELDTEQTHTEGTGKIDLGSETFDVVLTPHPKKPGILRLHSSIRVHGPIREPKITLAKNP
ncbi:MAG TPA: AsmA family protein [Burkholderiales bacterium]|nr:AsmA family protein [Burkholderiales bacterium]